MATRAVGETIKGIGNVCPKDMKMETSGLYVGAFEPLGLSAGKRAVSSSLLLCLHLQTPKGFHVYQGNQHFLREAV